MTESGSADSAVDAFAQLDHAQRRSQDPGCRPEAASADQPLAGADDGTGDEAAHKGGEGAVDATGDRATGNAGDREGEKSGGPEQP